MLESSTNLQMPLLARPFTLTQLQVIGWSICYGLHIAYLLPQVSVSKAVLGPSISLIFYWIVIYGHGFGLIPALFERQRYRAYAVAVVAFLVGVACLKIWVSHAVFFTLLGDKMYDYSLAQWGYVFFSTILVLMVSILFRMAVRYIDLLKTQEELKAQRFQAELNLLKAQVQPHFLFNTMNNIYYEAYKESPRTAQLLEKLAEIMRYFVEESPRQTVLLTTELRFLMNYIGLETIRLRYALQLDFDLTKPISLSLPPMLLMPLVENVFKHGINQRCSHNYVQICYEIQDNYFVFTVTNSLLADTKPLSTGFGLKNLRDRLQLLYPQRFTLQTGPQGTHYVAQLSIPII